MISIRAKIPAKTTKSLVWRHVHSTQVRRISTKPQLAHSSWFKLDDQGMVSLRQKCLPVSEPISSMYDKKHETNSHGYVV